MHYKLKRLVGGGDAFDDAEAGFGCLRAIGLRIDALGHSVNRTYLFGVRTVPKRRTAPGFHGRTKE